MSGTDQGDSKFSDNRPVRSRRRALIGGGTLTAVSRAYVQIAQLAIFIAAGRVLGPTEFGIFALVSAVSFLALKVAEAGWSEYIMAWSGPSAVLRQVYGLAWISGAVLALVGLCGAGITSFFTAHPSMPLLIAGFSVWIFLATPSAALTGAMIRQGQITLSALAIMVAETVGLVVTLLALHWGQGVLALVIGRLSLQLVFLAHTQFISGLIPQFGTDRVTLTEVARFSSNILVARLIASLRFYAATFIVGGFLGPAAVGFFRAGQRLTGAFAEVVGEPTRLLAWNSFRHARDSGAPDAFGRHAAVFFPALAIIAIPGFVGIALFGEDIVVGLLGEEWAPTAPVIAALSIASLLLSMGYATEPLLSLTNNTRMLPRLNAAYAVVGIGATFAAAPFGMVSIAVAQLVVAALIFVVNLWIYRTKIGISWVPVLVRLLPALVPIVISIGLLAYIDGLAVLASINPALRLLILSVPVMILYALLIAAFYLPLLRRLRREAAETERKGQDGMI